MISTIIFTAFVATYIVPVRVPGPMNHPIKYKIVTGAFAFLYDFSRFLESTIGIPHYILLNTIVDSCDRIKIRTFDRGQVLYHDQYIENVLVRIYTPTNVSKAALSPVIIFFHVPTEDSIKVVRYVIDNYREFSIDPKQVFLCGDSAGGNIAVVVERKLRREQKPLIRGVLLLYPLLQLVNFRSPSYLRYLPYQILSVLREDILTQVTNFYVNALFTENELFNNQHLSSKDYNKFYSKLNLQISGEHQIIGESHPDTWKLFDHNISPLLADDDILHNTPPTFIGACTYDVLLSDSQLYFQRLQKLNVKD
ncbi:unnamed protein product, partial [Rotaria magnacalcarata]